MITTKDETVWIAYYDGQTPYKEPKTTRTWFLNLLGYKICIWKKSITWDKWIE